MKPIILSLGGNRSEMDEDLNKRDIRNRFEFWKNWSNFLSRLDETRILEVERSLKQTLELKTCGGGHACNEFGFFRKPD